MIYLKAAGYVASLVLIFGMFGLFVELLKHLFGEWVILPLLGIMLVIVFSIFVQDQKEKLK